VLVAITTFTLAATFIVLLPGPDTLVVMRNLIRGGRATAIRTVLGILCGLVIWISVAVAGLTAVLSASENAYLALRIVGAAYLVWLGVQSFRSRGSMADLGEESSRRSLLGTGFVAGLLTDLLNPKVGVFFVTFLPGFIPAGYSVPAMSVLLGAIFLVLTVIYCAVLIAATGRLMGWLATDRVRHWVERTTGVILVGFGIRLAVES
jgi:RhtB (resistance to homoserine/threonine) family protein